LSNRYEIYKSNANYIEEKGLMTHREIFTHSWR